jgi:aryl-alcohol dehydrogenase-like predicted oxidoreductase
MHYTNFGSAGVKVSRIALGMGLREQYTDEGAERLVGHAIDSGVNFIDCANRYGLGDDRVNLRGTAEQALGRALRTRRDEVVITTKVTGAMGDGPNDSGAARVHIMREVERSLTRLQTDRIDVYLLHGWDDSTPIEETVRTLDDLVTQGKVLYFGCCNYAAWQVCKALWTADRLGAHSFICVQNEYSLLRRGLEKEMFGLIRDQGLGAMAYSPLKAGLLSGVYTPGQPPPPGSLWDQRPDEDYSSALPPSAAPLIAALRSIASERGVSVPQVAMAWVLSHPEITVAISGSDTIERLDDNLGALELELSPEERLTLDEASSAAATT